MTRAWLDRLLAAAKGVPLDLGQASVRTSTEGKRIAERLVPPAGPEDEALDVGCHDGTHTRRLRRLGYTVTPIDLEPRFSEGRQVNADEGLPFEDGRFTLVWCSEVIEHLRDPAAAAAEMRRVLAPGGTLVVSTPNSGAWFFRALALAGLPPERVQDPGHLHFFDLREVRSLFPRAEIYGYFPYAGVKRRIRRRLSLLTPTFVICERKR